MGAAVLVALQGLAARSKDLKRHTLGGGAEGIAARSSQLKCHTLGGLAARSLRLAPRGRELKCHTLQLAFRSKHAQGLAACSS